MPLAAAQAVSSALFTAAVAMRFWTAAGGDAVVALGVAKDPADADASVPAGGVVAVAVRARQASARSDHPRSVPPPARRERTWEARQPLDFPGTG